MKELECNGLCTIVSQALEEMKAEQGENFSLAAVNLAELQRRTGISRSRLRRLKKNNFKVVQHGLSMYDRKSINKPFGKAKGFCYN